jgi:hypothetical protein
LFYLTNLKHDIPLYGMMRAEAVSELSEFSPWRVFTSEQVANVGQKPNGARIEIYVFVNPGLSCLS